MKKLFSFWLVLLTMLCVPAIADENPEGVSEKATVTFKLHCDSLSKVYFTLNGNSVTPSPDGTITYSCVPGSEVTLSVNYSSMTVTVDV